MPWSHRRAKHPSTRSLEAPWIIVLITGDLCRSDNSRIGNECDSDVFKTRIV